MEEPKKILNNEENNMESIMDNIIDEISNIDKSKDTQSNKVVKKEIEKTKEKNEDSNPRKIKKQIKLSTIIYSILFIIFLVLFIFSLTKIIIYLRHAKATKDLTEELNQAIVVEVEEDDKPKYQINFENLKKMNPDTVGFLKVNGTDINYIVVKGNDNDFYLTHDFDKNYNSAGWVFADYRNNFEKMDRNTIIYGHNMKSGTMFSSLKNILNDEWKNDPDNMIVTLVTESKERQYQVFSAYIIDNTDDYTMVSFNDNEYLDFIKMIKGRSKYDFNVDVTANDKILTLSTCGATSKQRIVLHAKEV